MATSKKITFRTAASKKGHLTLYCVIEGKEYPLHSAVDPLKERDIITDQADPDKFDVLIVLGLGLGYHLKALEQLQSKYRRVIIIEILDGIEKKITENMHAAFLLQSNKIVIISGKDPEVVNHDLDSLIDFSNIKGLQVIEHPSSLRIFPNYYSEIRRLINTLINKKAGNEATKRAFGSRYLKNIIRNIPALDNYIPVSKLFSQFKSYPSLVVTSGPSLDRYISEIKQIQNNCFIIAVDSALPVLIGHDIMPDFVVSIDPQPYIYEHIRESNLGRCFPVISISVHPAVTAYINTQRAALPYMGAVSMNSHPLSQMVTAIAGEIGSIDSLTGTVAGDAVSLAICLGFETIALAGFDFAFSGFQIYARGTAYQKRYGHYFQSRIVTVESRNMEYIVKSSGALKVQGRFTRKAFIRYKEAIEDFTKQYVHKIATIDASGIPMKNVAVTLLKGLIPPSGKPLDKPAIIGEVITGAVTLRRIFQRNKLKTMLEDPELFRELLLESVGTVKGGDRYIRLLENLF